MKNQMDHMKWRLAVKFSVSVLIPIYEEYECSQVCGTFEDSS